MLEQINDFNNLHTLTIKSLDISFIPIITVHSIMTHAWKYTNNGSKDRSEKKDRQTKYPEILVLKSY